MSKQKYAIRYFTGEWNKPVPPEDANGQKPLPGVNIRVSKSDWGYTDALFAVSIIKDDGGKIKSMMLMDTDEGPYPSRKRLMAIRDLIDHHIEKHCET